MATTENSSAPPQLAVLLNHDHPHSDLPNHRDLDPEPTFSDEQVRGALEITASTGEFWLDWVKLKNILSYHLKQVLVEYPEAKMTTEQQTSSLGETFQELVKRLDDALHSFDEGPPFTLQRLCEILLSARSIYPKLSKLCLALEKNLLVTSTLKVCSDPYPLRSEQNSNGSYLGNGNADAVENGVVEDRDEVMEEAQEAEVGEETTMEMETTEDEEAVELTEANPTPEVDS